MPMPTGGAWPPPAHQPAYQAYAEWDAWYVGDTSTLSDLYIGRGATKIRPSQRAGGVIGTVSRWLWGNPPRGGQRDTRLHVPVPADLAAMSAGLLFSESPALTVESTEVQAAIERMERTLLKTLRHAAELGSVHGDVYLTPVIDKELSPDGVIPHFVPADAAIPTIRFGRLVEVTFWSVLHESAGTCVRLLEHHDVVNGAGRITYAVFEGSADQLGKMIPFAEHEATQYLAGEVDSTGAQPTGLKRLDVVRVPNAGAQRRWRKLGPLKYHGRSDMDGNEPIFDRIDEGWTSWMTDIRNGKGRITVADWMLQSNGPGSGATFDAEREVYVGLNMLPDKTSGGGNALTVTQFEIRHVEHKATIDSLMEVAMRHAGLSSQTMGEEGDVAMTATEAQARERQSFVSKGDRENEWTPAIADYAELHLELEALLFGGPPPERPNVEFSDGVSESPEAVARTVQLLHAAEAVSVDTRVRMVHPDWDDDQVAAEVTKIKGDQPAPIEVGSALGALAGNEPDDAGDGEEAPPGEE